MADFHHTINGSFPKHAVQLKVIDSGDECKLALRSPQYFDGEKTLTTLVLALWRHFFRCGSTQQCRSSFRSVLVSEYTSRLPATTSSTATAIGRQMRIEIYLLLLDLFFYSLSRLRCRRFSAVSLSVKGHMWTTDYEWTPNVWKVELLPMVISLRVWCEAVIEIICRRYHHTTWSSKLSEKQWVSIGWHDELIATICNKCSLDMAV